MNAVQYEFLIRRAFQCEKFGVAGANADIYRVLERSYVAAVDNKNPANREKLLIKYAFDCGEVAAYIKVAVAKFTKDFAQNLTNDEKKQIKDIMNLLQHPDINEIDKAIKKVEELMVDRGR